jgi:hypothetical protein
VFQNGTKLDPASETVGDGCGGRDDGRSLPVHPHLHLDSRKIFLKSQTIHISSRFNHFVFPVPGVLDEILVNKEKERLSGFFTFLPPLPPG